MDYESSYKTMKHKSGIILISSHARFSDTGQLVNGTSSQLIAYLHKNKISYISLFHSLFVGFPTLIEKEKKQQKIGFAFLPFSLKLMQDIAITCIFLWRNRKSIELYIGINPINGAIGVLGKKLGIVKKVVYYTADFSFKRFENSALNRIYLLLDDFSVKNADAVWNVSTRIQEEREKKYGQNKKFFVLPNSMPFPKQPDRQQNKHAMVLVTHMTKSIHFDMLLDATKKLSKKYKKLVLHIVGDGYERNRVEEEVKRKNLQKIILFHNHITHEKVIKLLKKSGIGLGIYTQDNPWTRFGDSMKVREYVAYGLPVIITNVPSTAIDVKRYSSGIVIKQKEEEFVNAAKILLSDKYSGYHANALKMAKENDYFILVKNALNNLGYT